MFEPALLDWISSNRKWALALVFGCAVLAHLPGLFGEFLDWDDGRYVSDQTRIQKFTLANVTDILDFRLTPSDPFDEYFPVRDSSLALDWAVWGPNPFGFRLTNLLLHGLNAILVGVFLWKMFGCWTAAWIAALLFAVHPVHVESVAWISERKDVLALFFCLLSFICFLTEGSRKRTWWLASVLFALLALLSKAAAVTIPAVLAAAVFLNRPRRDLLRLVPHGLAVLIYVPFFVVMRFQWFPLDYYYRQGHEPNLLAIVQVFARYGWHVLFPFRLSPYYDLNEELKRFDFVFVLAAAWTLAYAGALLFFRKARREVSVSLALFGVQLLPVLHILPHPIWIADRFLYFGAFFLYWPLALGAIRAREKWGAAAVGVCFLIVTLLGALSFSSSRTWESSRRLWTRVLELYPDAYPAHVNLANILRNERRFDAAANLLKGSLRKRPDDVALWLNLGTVFQEQRRFGEAIAVYTKVRKLDPENVGALYNEARSLQSLNRRAEAIGLLTECVRAQPGHVECAARLGNLLAQSGHLEEAEAQLKAALANQATHTGALYDLGVLAARRGDPVVARRYLGAVLAVEPRNARARQALSVLGSPAP